eukprot:UN13677
MSAQDDEIPCMKLTSKGSGDDPIFQGSAPTLEQFDRRALSSSIPDTRKLPRIIPMMGYKSMYMTNPHMRTHT